MCLIDDTKQKEYIRSTSVMLTWPCQEIVIRKSTSLIKLLHVIHAGRCCYELSWTVCLFLTVLHCSEKFFCLQHVFLHVKLFGFPEHILLLTAV